MSGGVEQIACEPAWPRPHPLELVSRSLGWVYKQAVEEAKNEDVAERIKELVLYVQSLYPDPARKALKGE